MRLFFFFIFISMLIIGCSETESSKRCEGDDGNYESVVKINKYYSFNKYHWLCHNKWLIFDEK